MAKMKSSAAFNPTNHTKGLNQTMFHTSELLVELDKRATTNAERNLKLADSVRDLTVAILIFTAAMAIIGGFQTYYTVKGVKLAERQGQHPPTSADSGTGKTSTLHVDNVTPNDGSNKPAGQKSQREPDDGGY